MQSGASVAGADRDRGRTVAELERELAEAREQLTATSEILRAISNSPTDIQPVLDAVAESAARLCEAFDSAIFRRDGDRLLLVAHHGPIPDVATLPLDRGTINGRAVLDGRTVQVADLQIEADEYPLGSALSRKQGVRTNLSVPLMREGVAIGTINLRRTEAQLFTERQVALLQTFADQAVIAIENTRLFEAEQARTREVTEALQYQTATSDVLGVISRSPTDVQPVFNMIAERAAQLCEAQFCFVYRFDGKLLHFVAHRGVTAEGVEVVRRAFPAPPSRGSVAARSVLDGRVAQIPDVTVDPDFILGDAARVAGYRSAVGVPMLRHGIPIGSIAVGRYEKGFFSERQIALLTIFADQAVIAIENVRLFEEVQAQTRELTESLEYQSATSDVLSVIGRSPSQIDPVCDAILQTAARLCDAEWALFFKLEDGKFHLAGSNNAESAYVKFMALNPPTLDRGSLAGRVALERTTVHIPDVLDDPEYTRLDAQRSGKFRSMLGVPLLRRDVPVGVIVMLHGVAKPFTGKQIELVTTFADQAVIAIENVRLFEEVQARTRELARLVEELRVLGEVGQTVNSSLDLQTVLSTILAHACEMSGTGGGAIYVFNNEQGAFELEASYNMGEDLVTAVRKRPVRLGETLVGQCGERREAVQIQDLSKAPRHPLFEMHLNAGVRALLGVPLLHQDEVVGALVVRRNQIGVFPPETVNLLQAFAGQSAIAVHNARLFTEIEEKGRELEIASQHKSQFVANMSHELRTPLAAILGYAELMQEGFYGALSEKSTDALTRIRSNGKHLLGLINTVLDIAKIEAGQFSLSLAEYALDSVVETVRVATESLAETKKLSLKTDVGKRLPIGLGDEQRLTQVLLNLVGNAIKFTDTGEVRISAGAKDGHFVVAVTDTGPGIPDEELKRVFEQFHQVDSSNTKAKGGTGLGLAIAKQIVEMHGGRIWVESTLGKGATFQMKLPVRAEFRKGATAS